MQTDLTPLHVVHALGQAKTRQGVSTRKRWWGSHWGVASRWKMIKMYDGHTSAPPRRASAVTHTNQVLVVLVNLVGKLQVSTRTLSSVLAFHPARTIKTPSIPTRTHRYPSSTSDHLAVFDHRPLNDNPHKLQTWRPRLRKQTSMQRPPSKTRSSSLIWAWRPSRCDTSALQTADVHTFTQSAGRP